MNRTEKTKKNVIYSFISQFFIIFLNFISRTIFIKILGNEILGINSLFTNILTLLSLTELGFGNAITYSLYKPIHDDDKKKITGIMNFYKKVYRYVAFIILGIGIILLPFLKYIVNLGESSTLNLFQIRIYFILFILNSLSSYLLAYKSNLIMADQKMFIIKKINLFITIFQFIVQSLCLIFFKNYFIYLVLQILFTFMNNVIISATSDKMYPYLKNNKLKIEDKDKSAILSNVKSIFIYKVATNIVENVDNILISILVGTVSVGLYSNYHMITSSLLGIISIFFSSFTASIGNLNIESDNKKKENIFYEVMIINSFIMIISTVCLLNCFGSFISFWVGESNKLSFLLTIVICFNYYIYGVLNPICVYRDSTGIFKEAKNISIVLAILNLVLSILLGKFYGMMGILGATFISKLLTNFWYQPYILFRDIFKSKPSQFFYDQLKNLIILFIAYVISYKFILIFNISGILLIVVSFIVSVIISFILVLVAYINDDNFKKLLSRLLKIYS